MRIALEEIALSKSVPNPRQALEGAGFPELLKSIQLQGVLTPVLVRPIWDQKSPAGYELIAGGRRYHASQQLKLADIPCIVRQMSDLEATTAQLAENDDREPLTGFEEGAAYAQAIEKFKLNRDAVADIFGKSRAHIYSRLRLHGLDAKVKKAIGEKGIPDSIADLIATIPDAKRQLQAVEAMTDYDYDAGGDRPVSFRGAQKIMEANFQVSLKNAPFEQTAHLNEAGPCTTCPKRSGNLNPDGSSPNICTDPACFKTKARLAGEAAAKKYTEIGIPLLSAAESEKLWQRHEGGDGLAYGAKFVKSTDTCALDKHQRQYRVLLEKEEQVYPVAAIAPSGKVYVMYRQNEVQKALIAKKIMKPVDQTSYQPARETAADVAKREAKEKLESAVTNAVVGACVERMRGKLAVATEYDLWMLVLKWRWASGDMDDGAQVVAKRRGWKDFCKDAEKLSVADLRALLVETFLVEEYCDAYTDGCVKHLADLLKVDRKGIEKAEKLKIQKAETEAQKAAAAATLTVKGSTTATKKKGGKGGK
jgi:ParB/RepB/Spo0J family partition protein